MNKIKSFLPLILIVFIVLLFFFPIFKGNIPFPGDLLVNSNPYSTQSFLGYNPGSYPNKAQGPDVITEIYPWRYFSIDQLKQGIIPFWNPHNFSGNPQIANFQTGLFYPLNVLYLILPFNMSWTLLIMLQPILAAIFMYLFLKEGIKLRNFPSIIGGVSFAFSSYMTVWIQYGNIGHTLLWLPLVLLFTKYFVRKKTSLNIFILSLSLSMSFLAGYIQGVFYIYILCFSYYLFLVLQEKKEVRNIKKHILFLIAILTPVLITFFQILPTLQLFSDSTRGAYTLSQIEKNLSPVTNWITIIFPDFFGNPATRNYWINGTYIERVLYPGTVVLMFAILSIFNKIKIIERKFFLIVGIISLVIATNLPFVKYFYLIPIPVISTTVATREFSIFIFSLIVIAAIGIDHFLSENKYKNKILFLYLLAYGFIWIVVVSLYKLSPDLSDNLKISIRNMIFPSVIMFLTVVAYFVKRINVKFFYVVIFSLVILDLLFFFGKITPFAPASFTYPKSPVIEFVSKNAGINRFWGYGSGYIMPNFQSVDQTYSPEGNDPLHIFRYTELLSSSLNGKLPQTLPRPDANIAPGYGTDDLKNNFFRKRVMDLLGIKYVLHKVDLKDSWQNPDLLTFPKEQYELVYKTYPWQIYENKDVLPRFFLTSDFILVKNKNQALFEIYNKDINLKKTLILEESPGVSLDSKSKGNVKLISYKSNKIEFKVNTSGDTLLFLSDNYYPEWNVRIDGNVSKILIADYTLRAVVIPKGEHNVEFFYNPTSFKKGLGVGLIGLTFLLLSSIYVKKYKEKN